MTPSRRGGLLDVIDEITLTQVIENFYDRMLADERLAHFFAGVNLVHLRAHQRSFLLAALSGPELFNELTLAASHLPLGLTDDDFDRALGHLMGAMADAGVPGTAVAPIAERLEPLRAHIVAAATRGRTA
ncbi:group 1 truncated hemoglobin [Lysobacter korlensis]|uniref:Group 1 truncated hemoglobin n=1 Tax=Lysobacter korlensis TaxID=553636 RepID=A0ABV6RXD7_9GAMM